MAQMVTYKIQNFSGLGAIMREDYLYFWMHVDLEA